MPDVTVSHRSTVPDDQKLARGIAIGLPLVTLVAAAIVGVVVGLATSFLVLAAGLLLGVIALLWGSLRTLTGDAPLPPELEELEATSRGVDGLALRKQMLLRALKDLDNERAIGKLEDEDYAQISAAYRAELKAVMRKMDASLAPYRERAEAFARAYLERKANAVEATPDEVPAPERRSGGEAGTGDAERTEGEGSRAPRKPCPRCHAANEADAKFCKECATRLVDAAPAKAPAESATSEASGDGTNAEESTHAT